MLIYLSIYRTVHQVSKVLREHRSMITLLECQGAKTRHVLTICMLLQQYMGKVDKAV